MRSAIPFIAIAVLLSITSFSLSPALAQVRINEVDYEDGWVELHNPGGTTVDVSGYNLCTFPTYAAISSLTVLSGNTSMGPGDFLVVEWSAGNFTASDGEVGLYVNGNDFSNPDNMAAYMEYGSAGHAREDEAVTAGLWETSEFVALAPSGKTVSFFDSPGETGQEDWGASNETQGGPNQVLPVEVTSFDAVADQQRIHLTWATASETNNAGFEVQHKRDGDFRQIAFIEGHGTTSAPQRYRFTVRDLAAGTHTFRLKQIDFDGAFEYSPVVEVTLAMESTHTLSSIYPNPAHQNARFTLAVRTSQPVTITLYDILGRRIQTLHNGTLQAGTTHAFAINGETLADGLYVIRVEGTTFTSVRRATLIE